jgi:DNA polymerase-1
LERELKRQPAKVIWGTGKRALHALTGKHQVFEWCGSPHRGAVIKRKKKLLHDFSDYTLLPTLHPAFTFRPGFGAYRQPILMHAGRAWDLARGKLPKWRWPAFILEPGPRMVNALRRMASERLPISIDVEARPSSGTMMCLGLGNRKRVVSIPWDPYWAGKFGDVPGIDSYPEGKEIRRLVEKILASSLPKVMQNGQFDILVLEDHGFTIRNFAFDTLFAHAVAAPSLRHDLSFMCACEFHGPRWKTIFHAKADSKGEDAFTKRNPLILRRYNAQDVWMTLRLYYRLKTRLYQTHQGWELFRDYMKQGAIALEMRRTGVQVDTDKFAYHRKILMARRGDAQTEFRQWARHLGMDDFNLNSNAQLKKLFFGICKVTPSRWSEQTGSPSLDEKALLKLITDRRIHVAALSRSLLRFRRYSKLVKTYIDGLARDKYDIVHPNWKIYGTITGRWSSADPNVMNIPKPRKKKLKKKDKYGKPIEKIIAPGLRDLFVAHHDGWVCEADYSQLELRLIALLSGDKVLLEAYERGEDVHYLNAQLLFGTKTPTSKERDLAKRFVYGCNYGGSAATLWQSLVVDFPDLTLMDVERMMRIWNLGHQAIVNWRNNMLRFARENGYIHDIFSSRREYFFGPPEPTKVYNFPIQTAAAYIIGKAIKKMRKMITDWEHESIMFQCHDALIMSTTNPVGTAKKLKKAMEMKLTFRGNTMHFPIDWKIGKNWGEAKGYETVEQIERMAA